MESQAAGFVEGTGLLAAVGMVFALFLIVATAAEQILEAMRGVLERFGIKLLKGGVSLDDAMKIAGEFLPQGTDDPTAKAALVKVHALQAVAKEYPRKLAEAVGRIDAVEADIKTAFAGIDAVAEVREKVLSDLSTVSAEVARLTGETERARVWTLRIFCAAVSFVLCWAVGFDALATAAASFPKQLPALAKFYQTTEAGSGYTLLGMMATALAASAGSSYWHDQLDRVRALKALKV
jgi:hypothetical protein